MVIPEVDFAEVPLSDAFDLLWMFAAELDPEKSEINPVLLPDPATEEGSQIIRGEAASARVSASVTNQPAMTLGKRNTRVALIRGKVPPMSHPETTMGRRRSFRSAPQASPTRTVIAIDCTPTNPYRQARGDAGAEKQFPSNGRGGVMREQVGTHLAPTGSHL